MQRFSNNRGKIWIKNGRPYRSHDLPSSYDNYTPAPVITFANRKINGNYFVINPRGTKMRYINLYVVGVWFDGDKIKRLQDYYTPL